MIYRYSMILTHHPDFFPQLVQILHPKLLLQFVDLVGRMNDGVKLVDDPGLLALETLAVSCISLLPEIVQTRILLFVELETLVLVEWPVFV